MSPLKTIALASLSFFFFSSPGYARCIELEGQTHCDDTLTVGGKIGVGLVNPSAQDHLVVSSGNVVGRVTQAAANQTSDVEEWWNSAGVVVSSVNAAGALVFSSGTIATLNVTTVIGSSGTITTLTASTVTVSQTLAVTGGTATIGTITLKGTGSGNANFQVVASTLSIGTNSPGGPLDFVVANSTALEINGTTVTIRDPYVLDGPGILYQSTQMVTDASFATASAVYQASGIKVTLTPLRASSLIRVVFSGLMSDSNPTGDVCLFTLQRNGVNLANGINDRFQMINMTSATSVAIPGFMSVDDSPASGSALTYEVYIRSSAGGATCTVNGNGAAVLQASEFLKKGS